MKRSKRSRAGHRRSAYLSRVLIAHDNQFVRIGLHKLLDRYRRFRVCGEASTVAETITKVKRLKPHIAIIALGLPDSTGLEAFTSELLQVQPRLKILVLANQYPPASRIKLSHTAIESALKAGVTGLVLKPDVNDLIFALDSARKNKLFVSSELVVTDADGLTRHPEQTPAWNDLTRREKEVFRLIASGKTSKEVATVLGISPRTVEAHRAAVLRKLGFKSRTELLLAAIRETGPGASRA